MDIIKYNFNNKLTNKLQECFKTILNLIGGIFVSDLRKIQMCQLQILKDLAKVCDDNNIDYMLACGSLIGAVRHGGFIPWDDDIDVYMTLDNYRKFSIIGQKCLGDKYFVQNWRTEKGYGCFWTQVRMNGTTSMPLHDKDWDIHFGIHIDIFPIIGIQDDQQKNKSKRNTLRFAQRC